MITPKVTIKNITNAKTVKTLPITIDLGSS